MKILVIRRDNIGDLVCTTPLLCALRKQIPDAQIELLANEYNYMALKNNPCVDAVHFYTKAKHRDHNQSRASIYFDRLKLIWKLRRNHFDLVLLPGGPSKSASNFSRWINPRRIVAQNNTTRPPYRHEVELACSLLKDIGLTYETLPVLVVSDPTETAILRTKKNIPTDAPCVAIHISARKPSQRWPIDKFAKLIERLHSLSPETHFILLWAPGSSDNPSHPGDDQKAEELSRLVHVPNIHFIPTSELNQLISALALSKTVICADGGAMHLAAGLNKNIVALFGKSDIEHWRPWGVPHIALQHPSLDVDAISIDDVINAYLKLGACQASCRLSHATNG